MISSLDARERIQKLIKIYGRITAFLSEKRDITCWCFGGLDLAREDILLFLVLLGFFVIVSLVSLNVN